MPIRAVSLEVINILSNLKKEEINTLIAKNIIKGNKTSLFIEIPNTFDIIFVNLYPDKSPGLVKDAKNGTTEFITNNSDKPLIIIIKKVINNWYFRLFERCFQILKIVRVWDLILLKKFKHSWI